MFLDCSVCLFLVLLFLSYLSFCHSAVLFTVVLLQCYVYILFLFHHECYWKISLNILFDFIVLMWLDCLCRFLSWFLVYISSVHLSVDDLTHWLYFQCMWLCICIMYHFSCDVNLFLHFLFHLCIFKYCYVTLNCFNLSHFFTVHS